MFGCQYTEELFVLFFCFGSTEDVWYQTKHSLNTEVVFLYLVPQFYGGPGITVRVII